MKINLFVIGLLALNTISAFCGGLTESDLVNTEEITLENVNNIDIVYSWENITLFEGNTDTLILKEYMSIDNSKYYARLSNSGGKVRIERGNRPFGIGTGILFNRFNARVEVYLPASYTKDINIKITSGNIETKGNHAGSKISLESSSGNISVNTLTANSVDLKSSSGRIEFLQINGNLTARASSGAINGGTVNGNAEVHTASGGITLDRIAGNISARSSSGSIELDRVSGGVNAEASSGRIECTVTESAGDISLTTSSGGVKLGLPRNFTFNFSSRTSSGHISTPFSDKLFSPLSDRRTVQGVIGETTSNNSRNINIRTRSGSIKIDWTN